MQLVSIVHGKVQSMDLGSNCLRPNPFFISWHDSRENRCDETAWEKGTRRWLKETRDRNVIFCLFLWAERNRKKIELMDGEMTSCPGFFFYNRPNSLTIFLLWRRMKKFREMDPLREFINFWNVSERSHSDDGSPNTSTIISYFSCRAAHRSNTVLLDRW